MCCLSLQVYFETLFWLGRSHGCLDMIITKNFPFNPGLSKIIRNKSQYKPLDWPSLHVILKHEHEHSGQRIYCQVSFRNVCVREWSIRKIFDAWAIIMCSPKFPPSSFFSPSNYNELLLGHEIEWYTGRILFGLYLMTNFRYILTVIHLFIYLYFVGRYSFMSI